MKDFGWALVQMKEGRAVTRIGWNNMFALILVPGSEFEVNRPPLNVHFKAGTKVKYAAHIDLVDFTGGAPSVQVWSPYNDDLLAQDYMLLPTGALHEEAPKNPKTTK